MHESDVLDLRRNSMAYQTYSGLRSCCFTTAYCLESSIFLYYLFKVSLGCLISFHFGLSFYFAYQKFVNNAFSYTTMVSPLCLLCIEIIALSILTAIGMCWDLKSKQFAVWHRNAAGYLFKCLFSAFCCLLSLLSLRNGLALVDADSAGLSAISMFRIVFILVFLLLCAIVKFYVWKTVNMWYWLLLGLLGIVQLLLLVLKIDFGLIPSSILYTPLQGILVLIIYRRILAIMDVDRYSAITYVATNSKIEHLFVSVFCVLSIAGYFIAILFLKRLSDHTEGLFDWDSAERKYYIFASIGISVGEILIFGEYAYDLLFDHIVVEVIYKKYSVIKRKGHSSLCFATPFLDEEEDEDSYSEMHVFYRKGIT